MKTKEDRLNSVWLMADMMDDLRLTCRYNMVVQYSIAYYTKIFKDNLRRMYLCIYSLFSELRTVRSFNRLKHCFFEQKKMLRAHELDDVRRCKTLQMGTRRGSPCTFPKIKLQYEMKKKNIFV